MRDWKQVFLTWKPHLRRLNWCFGHDLSFPPRDRWGAGRSLFHSAPYAGARRSLSTRCGTPAMWMVASGRGLRAFRLNRSSQLRRRWARSARGGRGGGGTSGGRGTIVTSWLRQWAIQLRRSFRPPTSFQRMACSPSGEETVVSAGRSRRRALTRRPRFPLALGLKHDARKEHPAQSESAAT